MKLWKIVLIGVGVLSIAALMGLLIARRVKEDRTLLRFPVYYYNATAVRLEPEEKRLPQADVNTVLDAAIKAIQEPPRSPSLARTMPDKEHFIEGYWLEAEVLNIAFSLDYYAMPPIEESLFRASLTWSLTGLPFVTQVCIFVDGAELNNAGGNAVGLLSHENVDIAPVISPERVTTRTFTLYFVNEDATALVSEERVTSNVNYNQLEKNIVQQLIDGPTEAGHVAAIPVETKIRDITTEDGICYVNLSSEFSSRFNGSPTLAHLMLYSIVNSLTVNISNVKRVQFMMDSELFDQFKGVPDFNRPYKKDLTLLEGYVAEE